MKIFISYSHRDKEWVSPTGSIPLIPWLEEQLSGEAELWTDHALKKHVGDDFTQLICQRIEEAHIAILLISQNFAKPGYIHTTELPLIKERSSKGELKVVPLLIGQLTTKSKIKLDWIFGLQTYPNDSKPLMEYINDSALWERTKVEILEAIENKIESINVNAELMCQTKNVQTTISTKENIPKINNTPQCLTSVEYDLNELEQSSLSTSEWLQETTEIQFDYWKEATRYHSPEAYCLVGLCYDFGEHTKRDYNEAFKFYKKAAEKGIARAMNCIGALYHWQGVIQDYSEAMKWYKKAAEKGEACAMVDIGVLYYYGQGVTQDYSEAMKWYKKAVEKGHSNAMMQIAVLYSRGQGVTQDYSEAMKWYKKAAEKGESKAMTNIGYIYTKGKGVTQDYSEAMKWYKKAAENGDIRVMRDIGVLYHNGQGVEQDYLEAMKWYRRAVKNGDVIAQDYIDQIKSGPSARIETTIGKNEPCPCGSGKKYKQCHGKVVKD